MDVPEFGRLIRQWRLRAGLTQEELAGRSGLSSRTIRDLERGRVRQPRLSSVRLLADSMKLTEQERDRLTVAAQPSTAAPSDRPEAVATPPEPTPSPAAPPDPVDAPLDAGHHGPGDRRGSAQAAPAGRTAFHHWHRGRAFRAVRLGALVGACLLAAVGSAADPAVVTQPASVPGQISYVARVGSDVSPAGALGSLGTAMAVEHPVARGDSLIVTVHLVNARPGAVAVTDTAGNSYTEAGESADGDGDRLVILVSLNANRLRPGSDRITATWPASGGDQISVDEFHGVTAVGSASGADSQHGFTRFIGQGWLCDEAVGGLLVSAVASYADRAGFGGPWQNLPDLTLDQHRLSTRYRLYGDASDCLDTEVPVGPATRWEALALAAR
ncbi:helix-turn-helix domain-containing protein [Kitasatospora paracochleata]|uniref:Transcriptional regulator with XRE-family HTH domain n=1 Tax=Kitasatospora paracochleata TaxID=58354 RepID=A0ABT1JAQ7_9ACTN|nr:helix-turn-helix domain-containing protein [Kitasatospora paracochleata]MCP2314542.1 transcriptional regulator with XRE-family HTH domain [Kitasatospora paracochleata]